MPRPLVLLPLVLACTHAGLPPTEVLPMSDALKAIAAGNARIVDAMRRGDAAALAAVFTDDATVMPPELGRIVHGRAALAELVTGRRVLDVTLTTLAVDVRGDLAVEVGTAALQVQSGGAEPVRRSARYLAVWRHEPDGAWRIAADAPVPDPVP